MDFFPTFARLIGSKIPTDRPIDGVDQTDVLFGKSETGNRDSLLTFIGPDIVAARWKQWRMYFTDVHPTGIGPQRDPGMFSASAPMGGYPKIYNIEMDPHEDLQVGALFGWAAAPALEVVKQYKETLKRYPNPPAGQPHALLMNAPSSWSVEAPVELTATVARRRMSVIGTKSTIGSRQLMSAFDPQRTSATPRTDLAPIEIAPYIWSAAPAAASGSGAPASGRNLLLIR